MTDRIEGAEPIGKVGDLLIGDPGLPNPSNISRKFITGAAFAAVAFAVVYKLPNLVDGVKNILNR